jgi:hypothetical protein
MNRHHVTIGRAAWILAAAAAVGLPGLAHGRDAGKGGAGKAVAGDDRIVTTRVGEVSARLYIPEEIKVCRGLMVHTMSDIMTSTDRWAELCKLLQWAHIELNISRGATQRPLKLRAALDESLKQFAAQCGHPELAHLPMAGAGLSAGGMVTGVMLKSPERTITSCVSCGWITDPTKQSPEEVRIPMLFTIGAINDAFNMVPDVEGKFYPGRKDGRLWALGFMWGCKHDFGPSATFFVPWIKTIAEARVPQDWDPLKGPAVLKEIKLEDGWLGDCATWETTWAAIAPYNEFKGDKSKAVWLPNRAMAYLWRAFQSKDAPVELTASAGKDQLKRYQPRAGQQLVVDPGQDVAIGAIGVEGLNVKKIGYYAGDVPLGESAAAPWSVVWKSPAPGPYPLLATWETADGKPGATTAALVIVRMKRAAP